MEARRPGEVSEYLWKSPEKGMWAWQLPKRGGLRLFLARSFGILPDAAKKY